MVVAATVAEPTPATVAPACLNVPCPDFEDATLIVTASSVLPDLSTMTVVQLRDRARELGVSLGKARTKAAIIEALGG